LQVATDVAAAAAVVPCTAATWHNKFQICYETCIRTCPSWRPTLSQQPPAVVLGENFHVPATFSGISETETLTPRKKENPKCHVLKDVRKKTVSKNFLKKNT